MAWANFGSILNSFPRYPAPPSLPFQLLPPPPPPSNKPRSGPAQLQRFCSCALPSSPSHTLSVRHSPPTPSPTAGRGLCWLLPGTAPTVHLLLALDPTGGWRSSFAAGEGGLCQVKGNLQPRLLLAAQAVPHVAFPTSPKPTVCSGGTSFSGSSHFLCPLRMHTALPLACLESLESWVLRRDCAVGGIELKDGRGAKTEREQETGWEPATWCPVCVQTRPHPRRCRCPPEPGGNFHTWTQVHLVLSSLHRAWR